MKAEPLLELLPETYAAALRLLERGLDEAAIAKTLRVPPESAGPLLAIAQAKLAAVVRSSRRQDRG